MSEQQESPILCPQLPDEPDAWMTKFGFYLLLGPTRTLNAAYCVYAEQKNANKLARKAARNNKKQLIAKSATHQWVEAAKKYDWVRRAQLYDRLLDERARHEYEQNRIKAMTTGFALEHERVKTLNELAILLKSELEQKELRWQHTTKQIGFGTNAQIIEEDVFNAPLVKEVRGLLDDLAKEVGGRIKKQEITGTDGAPMEVVFHAIVKSESVDDDFAQIVDADAS